MYRVADLAITLDRPMESLLVVHSPSPLSDYGCQGGAYTIKAEIKALRDSMDWRGLEHTRSRKKQVVVKIICLYSYYPGYAILIYCCVSRPRL